MSSSNGKTSAWVESNMITCAECSKEYHAFETIDTGLGGHVCESCSSEFMLKQLDRSTEELEQREDSHIRPITKQLKIIKDLLGNDHYICTITKSDEGRWESCPHTMVAMNLLSWHPRPIQAITHLLRGDTVMLRDIWIKIDKTKRRKNIED